jgi:hypothetical protein
MGVDKQDRIKQRAYEIWESAGRPHGAHEVHWQQASSEIDAEDATPAKPKAAKAPKAAAPKVAAPAAAKPAAAPKPAIKAAPAPKAAPKPRTKSKI